MSAAVLGGVSTKNGIRGATNVTKVYELRRADGEMIAWLQPRPPHCDRGRYYSMIEVPNFQSSADPWPRYYFDLDRGKAEIEAYLDAKKIDRTGAKWIEVT